MTDDSERSEPNKHRLLRFVDPRLARWLALLGSTVRRGECFIIPRQTLSKAWAVALGAVLAVLADLLTFPHLPSPASSLAPVSPSSSLSSTSGVDPVSGITSSINGELASAREAVDHIVVVLAVLLLIGFVAFVVGWLVVRADRRVARWAFRFGTAALLIDLLAELSGSSVASVCLWLLVSLASLAVLVVASRPAERFAATTWAWVKVRSRSGRETGSVQIKEENSGSA